jgi:hypothetical protein
MSALAPSRRLFRFSLRTLFVVVTVFCVWLGYNLNWLRQRRAVIQDSQSIQLIMEPRSAPGLLWVFGEQGYQQLIPHYYTSAWDPPFSPADLRELRLERQRLRALFPEAENVQLECEPPFSDASTMLARLDEIEGRMAAITADPSLRKPHERPMLIKEREILEKRLGANHPTTAPQNAGR